MRRIAMIVLAAGLLAGCGASEAPELDISIPTEAAPTARQSAALTRIVSDFDRHYRRGDGQRVCALMTPLTQSYVVEFIRSSVPGLSRATCAEIVTSEVFDADPPPAAAEASSGEFQTIAVSADGGSATITFADCRRWRLVEHGGAWLINDFPLLPRSLRDIRPRCAAPTA